MTQTKTSPFASAPREIDTASLDQVVGGASVVLHEARKQEESDKLTAEQSKK